MVDILKNYCIFVLEKRNAKATKRFAYEMLRYFGK